MMGLGPLKEGISGSWLLSLPCEDPVRWRPAASQEEGSEHRNTVSQHLHRRFPSFQNRADKCLLLKHPSLRYFVIAAGAKNRPPYCPLATAKPCLAPKAAAIPLCSSLQCLHLHSSKPFAHAPPILWEMSVSTLIP